MSGAIGQHAMSMGDYGNNDDRMLESVGDDSRRLYDIVQDLREDLLLKPQHQREFVWTDDKIQGWVQRISHPRNKPIGVISTYQITGGRDDSRDSAVYINDGMQRIIATMRFLDDPSEYGHTHDGAVRICKSYKMPVQHRVYKDHEEAMKDFQLLNYGTSLTPYEFYGGILRIDQRSSVWMEELRKVHVATEAGMFRLGIRVLVGRKAHKFLRHDYALVHRHMTGNDMPVSYSVSGDVVKPDDGTVVEQRLLEVLKSRSTPEIIKQCQSLSGAIDRSVATIADLWQRLTIAEKMNEGDTMNPAVYRYLLDAGIWRLNADKPNSEWESFVSKLLFHTKGVGVIVDPKDPRNRVTMNLGNLGQLPAICELIDSRFCLRSPRRHKNTKTMKVGCDVGHVMPFASNGNGETVAEPASRNRARGAQPIDGLNP